MGWLSGIAGFLGGILGGRIDGIFDRRRERKVAMALLKAQLRSLQGRITTKCCSEKDRRFVQKEFNRFIKSKALAETIRNIQTAVEDD